MIFRSRVNSLFFSLFFVLFNFGVAQAANIDKPETFEQSKRVLSAIYKNNNSTFYSGCKFDKKGYVDFRTCSYKPKDYKNKRSKKIEWEHIVPASRLGGNLTCWADAKSVCSFGRSGRECCRSKSALFNQMESDMHNLVPAVGELNQFRSNYDFGVVHGEPRMFGELDFEIDPKTKTVEVSDELRGVIARIYIYMAYKYSIRLTKDEIDMFALWNNLYPPSEWEIWKNAAVKEIQGDDNVFVSNYRIFEINSIR